MPAAKPSTFVKSFFAESVQSAMECARLEMGPDALLLESREAPPEARHLGDFEAVFAACSEPLRGAAAPASGEVEALRREVAEIRELLARTSPSVAPQTAPLELIAPRLIDAGVEPALAREIEEAAKRRLWQRSPQRSAMRLAAAHDPRSLFEAAAEEIMDRFAVNSEIGRVTALVGPPGTGKTTALVKMAVQYGIARNRAVRLISTDTQRIGGAEQLRTYAGILGVPFQAVECGAALAQAIDSAPESSLVLVDTPGFSATLLQDLGAELAGFLAHRQDIDTHLVLTASMRLEDLYHAAELYECFEPARLLFTRVDETSSLAAAFCLAARRNKPVSFLSAGQSIPEDLEAATKERIADSLVRQLPSALEAVA